MQIIEVVAGNRHVYANLCQGYEAEFSSITGKKPDAAGLFALDTVLGGQIKGFLFYEAESPIGFTAVKLAQSGNEVCEFYVVPSMRGHCLGRRFAHEVFRMFPGPWEVKQLQGARLATCFWQRAIREFTGGKFEEDVFDDRYWGRVVRQCFVSQDCSE